MQEHAATVRRRVLRASAAAILATFVIAAAAAHAGAIVLYGDAPDDLRLDLIPLSLLIGQGVALARLAIAYVANPLPVRYLRRYIGARPTWRPGPVPGEPHAVGADLVARGLAPAVSATEIDGDAPGTVVDLYQSPDQLVTAAVGRTTGHVTLTSRLSDETVATTATMYIPETDRMATRAARKATTDDLVEAHRSLLGEVVADGRRPVPASPALWAEVCEAEREGYTEIGPWLGALINVNGGRSLGRLMVKPTTRRAERRSGATVPSTDVVYGTSSLAHAFGASGPIRQR